MTWWFISMGLQSVKYYFAACDLAISVPKASNIILLKVLMIWKSSILIEYLHCSHRWSNNSTCVRRIMLCQSRGLKRWTRFLPIWRSGGWKPSHPQTMVAVYNSMGVAVVDVRECRGQEAVLATNAMLLQDLIHISVLLSWMVVLMAVDFFFLPYTQSVEVGLAQNAQI